MKTKLYITGTLAMLISVILIGCIWLPRRPKALVSKNTSTIQTTSDTELESEPQLTSSNVAESQPVFNVTDYVNRKYKQEIKMLAKLVYVEARGLKSQTEQACVIWVVLNRVDRDNSSIKAVILAPKQFAYRADAPMIDDFNRDLRELARDVLRRWVLEKRGEKDVGRVLPADYYFFYGKKGHNWFRKEYSSKKYWDYSLKSPYAS